MASAERANHFRLESRRQLEERLDEVSDPGRNMDYLALRQLGTRNPVIWSRAILFLCFIAW